MVIVSLMQSFVASLSARKVYSGEKEGRNRSRGEGGKRLDDNDNAGDKTRAKKTDMYNILNARSRRNHPHWC